MERVERGRLEYLVKTGSLPDDAKLDLALSNFTAKVLPLPSISASSTKGEKVAPRSDYLCFMSTLRAEYPHI